VYNGERYLERALDTLLGQTYSDFVLVVSDNASADRTREICLDRASTDSRVRYARNERNLGAAENYNGVFRAAKGRYFKWATHDDEYAPGFIQRCVEVLEENAESVLCYAPAVFIDENGDEIGRESDEPDYTSARPSERFHAWVFEKQEGWCHPIMGVIRTDALATTPLIGKYTSSDRVLIAELALRGAMHRLPEYLYYRRDHPGRSTAQGQSVEDVVAWYDPAVRPGRVYMPRWRWGWEYCSAVARVPMSPLEKTACARMMAKWYTRRRGRLARELYRWVRRGHGDSGGG
jgi:glycosyltransferase involved in cell wall biosynthesis